MRKDVCLNKSKIKEQQILEVAQDEFYKYGLDGVNMDIVSNKANVSKRTLYRYFGSKNELFKAIFTKILNEIDDNVVFDFKKNVSFKKNASNVIANLIKFQNQAKLLKCRYITIRERLKNLEDNSYIPIEAIMRKRKRFSAWIKICQRLKYITNEYDSQYIADFLLSMIDGIIVFPKLLSRQAKIVDKDYASCNVENIIKAFLLIFGTEKISN